MELQIELTTWLGFLFANSCPLISQLFDASHRRRENQGIPGTISPVENGLRTKIGRKGGLGLESCKEEP